MLTVLIRGIVLLALFGGTYAAARPNERPE
jgi:hypothetical protein